MTHSHEPEPVVHEEVHTPVVHEATHETVSYRSSTSSMLERGVIFVFGLIQLVILLRIVLLLVAAREGNAIVSFIYDVSDLFVAPFRGILAMNQVGRGETALDVAAIVALIGWSIIELVILAGVRLARR